MTEASTRRDRGRIVWAVQVVWVLLFVFVGIVVAVPFLLLSGARFIAERKADGQREQQR